MESISERKKRAVGVCNEDEENSVAFKYNWGKVELPIVDQYAEISKDYSWDAHKAKALGRGKSLVGKMDAILTDSHRDTRIKIFIMIMLLCQS